ncbi:MAG: PIG-L family deacetylase [Sedimentisphaerales bacterium]|nr:PIG-L family deacetylase [Sedimentisphaerales bacterium]
MTKTKSHKHMRNYNNCAVIVAHPDDETLWVGGLMLMNPQVKWTVVTLCRKSDTDRAPKFFKALEKFGAEGFMADLDDGPEQTPLDNNEVQRTIAELLPSNRFDLIITHSPSGEYTRHLRHEETAKAVLALWKSDRLLSDELWTFAYEDSDRKYLPRAIKDADLLIGLNEETWRKKYDIITGIYGFNKNSFEAKTTPREEAFWLFKAGLLNTEKGI